MYSYIHIFIYSYIHIFCESSWSHDTKQNVDCSNSFFTSILTSHAWCFVTVVVAATCTASAAWGIASGGIISSFASTLQCLLSHKVQKQGVIATSYHQPHQEYIPMGQTLGTVEFSVSSIIEPTILRQVWPIWKFPEIGVAPHHPFEMGFPYHKLLGYPYFWKPP